MRAFKVKNERYRDILGTNVLNFSWIRRLPHPLVVLGEFFGEIFDPVLILILIESLIITLHYLDIENKYIIKQKLVRIHHLCVMPMCGVVGLYMIFKQRRPTYDIYTERQIGSVYGMPSGDSMFCAILACCMSGSIYRKIIPMIIVSYSRIARGYHSLAQVFAGTLTGIALHILQSIYDDGICPYIWLFSFFSPFLVLFDPVLKKTEPMDYYNLYGWLFIDMVSLIFDYIVVGPDEYNIFSFIPFDLRVLLFIILSIITTTIGTYICREGVILSLV